MRLTRPGLALDPLRTLFETGTVAGLTDTELLERFAARGNGLEDDRADAAFAALVARHGPMVRRVCRLLLGDPNDANDAFQATFLVLARKAGAIRRPELLANWLYVTAQRAARKLRTQAARRSKRETRGAIMALARVWTDPDGITRHAALREQAWVVHEEVDRLPRACRAVVVLCELEGLKHEEVARRLGCTDRTLRRRLVRARELLRARLTRRGVTPTAGLLAAALGPEPASAAISQITVDATARAALSFAAGRATAGTVATTASDLAERVIAPNLWNKLKAIAITSGVGIVLAAGVGGAIAVVSGLAAHVGGNGGQASSALQPLPQSQPSEAPEAKELTPAEQYQALVRQYDQARTAYRKLGEQAKTKADVLAARKDQPIPEKEFSPRFFDLANRYPNDPVAVNALIWIIEKSLTYSYRFDEPSAETTSRAMAILARDHLGDPRLGPLCLTLIYRPSPERDALLLVAAERSPDRIVRGHATLALARYLKMKGEFVQTLNKPAVEGGYDEAVLRAMYGPQYLAQLRAADAVAILYEAALRFAQVDAKYGDVPHSSRIGPRNRSLAGKFSDPGARRAERLVPTIRREGRHQAIENAYNAAMLAADRATDPARKKRYSPPGMPRRTESNSNEHCPTWRDYGRKMWQLVQDSPRDPSAVDAMIWLLWASPSFRDDLAERNAVVSQVVDLLIRDHLDTIVAHINAPNVVFVLNSEDAFPAPHRDRLLPRPLFEHGRDRDSGPDAGSPWHGTSKPRVCSSRASITGPTDGAGERSTSSIRRVSSSSARRTTGRSRARLSRSWQR